MLNAVPIGVVGVDERITRVFTTSIGEPRMVAARPADRPDRMCVPMLSCSELDEKNKINQYQTYLKVGSGEEEGLGRIVGNQLRGVNDAITRLHVRF